MAIHFDLYNRIIYPTIISYYLLLFILGFLDYPKILSFGQDILLSF